MSLHSARLWRGPDGLHWMETGEDWYDQAAEQRVYPLTEAVQDPETGRWSPSPTGHRRRQVASSPSRAGYTEVPADPWAEPHVARLRQELARPLADTEQQTGQPYTAVAALDEAFEDVAALPEQLRDRRHAAASQAARSGFQRGQRSRFRR